MEQISVLNVIWGNPGKIHRGAILIILKERTGLAGMELIKVERRFSRQKKQRW